MRGNRASGRPLCPLVKNTPLGRGELRSGAKRELHAGGRAAEIAEEIAPEVRRKVSMEELLVIGKFRASTYCIFAEPFS